MKQQRIKQTLLAAAIAAIGLPLYAQNLPVGGTVSRGTATISTSGNTMTINQSSDILATNWQSFNIGAGNTVRFQQPNATSIALARVTGTTASTINGNMNANGQVFLVNPNGILFGQTAQVNVGGLVATTHAIADSAITNSGVMRFSRASYADVVNLGIINATGANASVVLSSYRNVTNQGRITADGTISLVSSEAMDLKRSVAGGLVGTEISLPFGDRGGDVDNVNGTLNARLIVLNAGFTIRNSGNIQAGELQMATSNIYGYGEIINDTDHSINAEKMMIHTDRFVNMNRAQINAGTFMATMNRGISISGAPSLGGFNNSGYINVRNNLSISSGENSGVENNNLIQAGNILSINSGYLLNGRNGVFSGSRQTRIAAHSGNILNYGIIGNRWGKTIITSTGRGRLTVNTGKIWNWATDADSSGGTGSKTSSFGASGRSAEDM